MSISSVSSGETDVQALARQLLAVVDANRDGQVSITEFGDFLRNLLQGPSRIVANASTSGSSAGAASVRGTTGLVTPLASTPIFLGFDASRAQSAAGTLKYDAYNVLKSYDPTDPQAMQKAFTVLDGMHPGKFELDAQGNLMLTGTADGYIGARPVNRSSDWTNKNQDWAWQWMAYNTAHVGPAGEVA